MPNQQLIYLATENQPVRSNVELYTSCHLYDDVNDKQLYFVIERHLIPIR